MSAFRRWALPLLVSALASPALANTTVYTSQAAFLAALTSSYTESFTGMSDLNQPANPASYSNGTFSFELFASQGLFGNYFGSAVDSVGANQVGDDLVVTPGPKSLAVGGFFFATDINSDFQSVAITVTTNDGTFASFTPVSLADSFRGFISDVAITSLTLSAPGDGLYGTVDDITIGSTVPEPSTIVLAGLGLAALRTRRQRS